MSFRQTNLSRLLTLQFLVTTAGTPENLSCKRRATTIAFVVSANPGLVGPTITDSSSLFLVAGFQPGDQIVITSTSGLNNGTYQVDTVTAGTITLVKKNTLTTETAGAAGTVVIKADKTIPDGVDLLIKAKRANGGDVCVACCSEQALNTATGHFLLDAEQSLRLQVSSLSAVWLDATVSGEGVEICFEQNNRS